MDFSKGVLFDPGYSKYTLAFSLNIDAAYNMIFSIKAFNQRKTKFKIIYPQLLKLFEPTVSFGVLISIYSIPFLSPRSSAITLPRIFVSNTSQNVPTHETI